MEYAMPGDALMKKVLYVLNDCMRKFSYERSASLHRALQGPGEPFSLHILRSDAYLGYDAGHNRGEYNIYRLPDFADYDAILLDINTTIGDDSDASGDLAMRHVINAAAASGKPVLSMANHIPGFRYVGIDNYAAMGSIIRNLHRSHGLTDLWFALGPADNFENQARARGLKDYCASNDLPCGEDRIYSESFIVECGIHAFETLLHRHGGRLPQAVICANDQIAMGVCHAARAAGYSVPEDFLVTGFDNDDLSAAFSPAITTVDQQPWNMGDTCVDVLRRIWRGESVPEVVTTPARLVLRQSTERGLTADGGNAPAAQDYIGGELSSTDFNYRMSVMQYRLPGCESIEEICLALIDCVSVLNCDGLALVLDGRLFDPDRMLSFREETGQMRDLASGLSIEGYPDTLELIFQWEKGSDARFPRRKLGANPSTLSLNGTQSNYLFAPLHFMERTAGYLCVRNCLDLMRIRGVSALVSTLTMALRSHFATRNLSYINHVLSGVSMKDGLTGLYNRLGYHELAYPLFRDVSGRGEKLAILFMDMDRLKYINDAYGHTAGDQAILCVADAIRQALPKDAIPVRYGGDEFLVLMPDLGPDATQALMRSVADALPGHARDLGLPETPGISFGCVLTDPDSDKSLDEYVQQADALMYRQKKAKKAQRT